MPKILRSLLSISLLLLAACAAADTAGDATVPVGPDGIEGDT